MVKFRAETELYRFIPWRTRFGRQVEFGHTYGTSDMTVVHGTQFRIIVQLAANGDPIMDASQTWPEELIRPKTFPHNGLFVLHVETIVTKTDRWQTVQHRACIREVTCHVAR